MKYRAQYTLHGTYKGRDRSVTLTGDVEANSLLACFDTIVADVYDQAKDFLPIRRLSMELQQVVEPWVHNPPQTESSSPIDL